MKNSKAENLLRWSLLILVLLFATYGCVRVQPVAQHPSQSASDNPVVIRSVAADYDQVWSDLTMALNERGLVISSVSHVGEMLERTGKALNDNTKIFARAKVMEFCSAIISRKMMEKDPHYIAFCPYQIMVYSLPQDPGKVYLAYRRLLWGHVKDRAVLEAVENLLDGLVTEVIEMQEEYK